MTTPHLHLSGDPDADELISRDPLALLIGMVLDQQFPLERAFASPAELQRRLGGHLDVAEIASMDPEQLAAVFSRRPSLHRFPGSMAGRVQALCELIVHRFDARPSRVWTDASDAVTLLATLRSLPGFGDQKARIFVALLGKQLGVRPDGWIAASAPYGEPGSFRSIADIVDARTLAQVRAFKKSMKAAARATAEQEPTGRPGDRETAARKKLPGQAGPRSASGNAERPTGAAGKKAPATRSSVARTKATRSDGTAGRRRPEASGAGNG